MFLALPSVPSNVFWFFFFVSLPHKSGQLHRSIHNSSKKFHFIVIMGKLDLNILRSSSVFLDMHYFALNNLDFQVLFCHLFTHFCEDFFLFTLSLLVMNPGQDPPFTFWKVKFLYQLHCVDRITILKKF